MSEWFPVKVGLRKGCVMSPLLFNVYMDGMVWFGRCIRRFKGCI